MEAPLATRHINASLFISQTGIMAFLSITPAKWRWKLALKKSAESAYPWQILAWNILSFMVPLHQRSVVSLTFEHILPGQCVRLYQILERYTRMTGRPAYDAQCSVFRHLLTLRQCIAELDLWPMVIHLVPYLLLQRDSVGVSSRNEGTRLPCARFSH